MSAPVAAIVRRVVVVGAGHAGGTFVGLLRQAGYAGEVVLVGEEPDPPYHRPPLSKAFVSGKLEQWLRDPAFYAEQDITMSLDESVESIDTAGHRVLTSIGRRVEYDVLVLATGASPRTLPIPGSRLKGVMTLRTLTDARRLRDAVTAGGAVAVIGGGSVGLEVAAAARANGVAVTVVEREDRVLSRVASPTLSKVLEEHHRSRGTTVLTGALIAAFEGNGTRLRRVLLDDGTTVACDAAVVGVGAVPRDALAAAAGLCCEGGIVVDGGARTSDPSVLAIGDVTVRARPGGVDLIRLESIPSAVEQARQAVATIMGQTPVDAEVPWFWSDQFDLRLKIAGVVREPYTTVVRGDAGSGRFALFHHDDGALVAVESANSPADFMAGKRLLTDARKVDPLQLADPDVPLRSLAIA
jgi:3-phenylpropionate/trans-cinnamate dioxygenase ferredoxin reductase subunit